MSVKYAVPMQLEITPFKFGERPQVTLPNPLILKVLKEDGIRKLVNDHYTLLRESKVAHLFPVDDQKFEEAIKHSADFFIQICGGPQYYNENRGQPMLPYRHSPFAITLEFRNVWLECYRSALLQLPIPEELIQSYWDYINVFSIKMVNTEESGG